MKLYKFILSSYCETKIAKIVIDVEEKPKTYVVKSSICNTRINKSDIGVASGYSRNTVILLEDDFEKAKDILICSLQRKIIDEKNSIETKIKCGNERISKYENDIENVRNMEKESEVN